MKTSLILIFLCFCVFAKDPFGPDGYGGGSPAESVSNVELKGGKLYITWNKTTTYFFPEGVQQSKRVWKDVYCSSNGVIVLDKQLMANYHPISTTPESIEWPTNQ